MDLGQTLKNVVEGAAAVPRLAFATLGFAAIYGTFAGLTVLVGQTLLVRAGAARLIDSRPVTPAQRRREIGASLMSVAVFGGSGWATLALNDLGWVRVLWTFSPARVLPDLVLITLWNELHFYLCHRLLHTQWLYRHVHREHHRSVVPTPFSTYAFHPVEAVLLGSVMLTFMLMRDLSIGAVVLFPMVSLALNCLGHSNVELFPGRGWGRLFAASVRHRSHHRHASGNYGFSISWLDRLDGLLRGR